METSRLGPQARRAYEVLRQRIRSGELPPGTRLPGYPQLAAEFGLAPMTLRQALARLQTEGLLSSEPGRGTFVKGAAPPTVLVVDDEAPVRAILREHVENAGHWVIEASGPADAIRALEEASGIRLVMTDIRMPQTSDGVDLIRAIRRRWPQIPVAAITGFPDDLTDLYNTPEFPILVIPKPYRAAQIEEALRLAQVASSSGGERVVFTLPAPPEKQAVLVADDDNESRAVLGEMVRGLDREFVEVASLAELLGALGRRQFSHVFLDAALPGSGSDLAAAIFKAHPSTVVILLGDRPEAISGAVRFHSLLLRPFDADAVALALDLRRSTPLNATAARRPVSIAEASSREA